MAIEPVSVLAWLFKAGLSSLAKRAWSSARPQNLDALLRQAVEDWAANLPRDLALTAAAMFPAQASDAEVADDARPGVRSLRGSILSREIPTQDEWRFAVLGQWLARKESLQKDGQQFFQAPREVAEPHLNNLADRLRHACAKDLDLLASTVLGLADASRERPSGRLELAALEMCDHRLSSCHADLDIKLVNMGPLAFVTSVEIEIAKLTFLEHALPRFSMVRVSGIYDISVHPGEVPVTIDVPVSQVVYPNDVDRFVLRMSIAPEFARVFREAVCLIRGTLTYNGDQELDLGELVGSLPWNCLVRGQRGTRDTARHAARVNSERLESLLAETSARRSGRIDKLVQEMEASKIEFGLP